MIKKRIFEEQCIPKPNPATTLFCKGLPGAAARDCHKAYVPTVAKVAEPTMRHDGQSLYFELGWSGSSMPDLPVDNRFAVFTGLAD